MERLTFFTILKSNLKCAFCRNKECTVRYMPKRKRNDYYDGVRYVTTCKKDREAREKAILKKRLP